MKIKPCKNCGKTPNVVSYTDDTVFPMKKVYKADHHCIIDTEEKAIKKWNIEQAV